METRHTGIIAWFASNPVAANLLMFLILAFGIASAFSIRKQTTPDFELNYINVRIPYLGAAPQEVEEGVVIKVEEAIQDIPGIVDIDSTATEGMGTVTAEVSLSVDVNQVLSEIKTRVDAISTFPALAEKPVIYKVDAKIHVVFIAIYGDLDEFARKTVAQNVRDDLMALSAVNQVELLSDEDYEISVEVSEHTLREYKLTMSEIAEAIRRTSVDLPGGTIRSSGGNVLLRTEGQLYTGRDYKGLVLRTNPDGTRLLLGEVATITDGFVEDGGFGRFNDAPTAIMRVMATSQQSELKTAALVHEYVKEKSESLPEGVGIKVWGDRAHYLEERLDMMMTNMFQGAILVFLILTLFLRVKVAMWVIVGIPITFFGALWLMPYGPWPVTVNMISLFGFILVLGIVVDDAIIIGESIYTKSRADGHTLDNVIAGAHKVAVAATFGVLTTMAAFAPTLFIGGTVGPFFEAMSVVVILCLMFSLIESKLILPAHLAHTNMDRISDEELFRPYSELNWFARFPRSFLRLQRGVQNGMRRTIDKRYKPLLERAVANRGITVTLFVGVLILTGGLMASGMLRIVVFPDVPSDFIQALVEMQNGSSLQQRDDALLRIEESVVAVNEKYLADNPGANVPAHSIATIATRPSGGFVVVELVRAEDRSISQEEVTAQWRTNLGEIPGVRSIDFNEGNNLGGGPPLSFKLSGDNYELLEKAARELEEHMNTYAGVYDIRNSASLGSEEIQLTIKPQAEALGLTMASLGQQVRQAFYGEEAQRIQRGKDELKVMVRYPAAERRSVANLENMRIKTPGGDAVPFSTVAEVKFGNSYSSITRQNRRRTITVSANLDTDVAEPGKITESVSTDYIPKLLAQHPGVTFGLEGASQEQVEFFANLKRASIAALFMIYALIAIPLRSYIQPMIIMSVIPFGFIGAALGHLVVGVPISMFSIFGLIALAGVVVNDSLIMVDFINKARRQQGMAPEEAVIQSGTQRFRAIILTSLTTAVGLMPIIFEKSLQAQFVIPMAISISFGILFATVITLFLIPSLYLLAMDCRAWFRRRWAWFMGRDPLSADHART